MNCESVAAIEISLWGTSGGAAVGTVNETKFWGEKLLFNRIRDGGDPDFFWYGEEPGTEESNLPTLIQYKSYKLRFCIKIQGHN